MAEPSTRGQRGIDFVFAAQTLAPGQRTVVVRDREAFQSRYGGLVPIAAGHDTSGGAYGQLAESLSDTGQQITLLDAPGAVIQRFTYGSETPWPARANGHGSSLELIDVTGTASDPGNWRASTGWGGSPAAAGLAPDNRVVINEVLARTAAPDVDRVELHNRSATAADIGGWLLSNTVDGPFRYHFPSPTVIPAFGYQVSSETQLGFELDGEAGGDVWLISADDRGRPLQFVDHVQFGASARGVSLGGWPGEGDRLVQLAETTFGTVNSGLLIPDVVISEIEYDPPDPDGDRGRLQADDFEFVELTNRTDQPIDVSGWTIAGATRLTLADATRLPPHQSLTLVRFDPADAPRRIFSGSPWAWTCRRRWQVPISSCWTMPAAEFNC